MQLSKLSLTVLLSFLFLFSACKKEEVEGTWYFYDQTKCADVWDQYFITTATFEDLIEYHFSTATDVVIDEIQILDDGAVEQLCEACICTTGTRIRVQADIQYQATMEAEGFMLE